MIWIYIFGDWRKGDKLVSDSFGIPIDEGHEHHTYFTFMEESVENHYDFINTKASKSAVWIEVKLKELSAQLIDESLEFRDSTISLPTADFNAIFLIRHLGQHFAGAEAT